LSFNILRHVNITHAYKHGAYVLKKLLGNDLVGSYSYVSFTTKAAATEVLQ